MLPWHLAKVKHGSLFVKRKIHKLVCLAVILEEKYQPHNNAFV